MMDNNTEGAENVPVPMPRSHVMSPNESEKSDQIDEKMVKNALVNRLVYRIRNTIHFKRKITIILKNLSWCFGFNKHIEVLNLCVNDSKKIFEASSHIGVVYDFETNTQTLLQGHVCLT